MREVSVILLWIIFMYVFTASVLYRFNHPAMSETELLLKMPDALRFER